MKADVRDIEKLFQALGREKRMRILNFLIRNDGKTVSEISMHLGIPFNTVSRHLQILAEVGLVHGKKIVNEVIYAIRPHMYAGKNGVFLALIKHAYEKEEKKEELGRNVLDALFMTSGPAVIRYLKGR